MRSLALPALVIAALMAAAGCAGASGPSPTPSPPGVPDDVLRLRLTITQAIAPVERFGWLSPVAITGDRIVVTPGAVPAIYPGPIVMPLFGQEITEAGWAQIVQQAGRLGLLRGGDFSGGAVMPGAAQGRIELLVDGTVRVLTGNPEAQIVCVTTPCEPQPGTPEAFGELWRHLLDLESWLGAHLGPQDEYVPRAYGVLVGPAPAPEPGLTSEIQDWPLDIPLATFGGPVGMTGFRCGVVEDDDAAALRPALARANQLTQWVQDPDTSATFGLRVRPMLPGEDLCAELFGG
jgi:hypothetical protein